MNNELSIKGWFQTAYKEECNQLIFLPADIVLHKITGPCATEIPQNVIYISKNGIGSETIFKNGKVTDSVFVKNTIMAFINGESTIGIAFDTTVDSITINEIVKNLCKIKKSFLYLIGYKDQGDLEFPDTAFFNDLYKKMNGETDITEKINILSDINRQYALKCKRYMAFLELLGGVNDSKGKQEMLIDSMPVILSNCFTLKDSKKIMTLYYPLFHNKCPCSLEIKPDEIRKFRR